MHKKPLDVLKKLFLKNKVLEIQDVMSALKATSSRTAQRYLKRLGYLSSYTHAGAYYTLKEVPEFDKNGLWHYGDIGFSKHGTLMETIVHLVDASRQGTTSSELEKLQRVYVQNALLSLVKAKKIARKEVDGLYVYFSLDPEKGSEQVLRREKTDLALPDAIVIQILITTIQSTPGYVTADEIAQKLQKQGSSITLDQVKQVFKEHSLGKKTPDSKA